MLSQSHACRGLESYIKPRGIRPYLGEIVSGQSEDITPRHPPLRRSRSVQRGPDMHPSWGALCNLVLQPSCAASGLDSPSWEIDMTAQSIVPAALAWPLDAFL